MASIPSCAQPFLHAVAPAFTRPTFARITVLLLAALIAVGPRTVSNLLRTAAPLAPGHPASYRRVFSRARWRSFPLARAVATLVLPLVPGDRAVRLVGDDTVEEHRGDRVHGKARHRDPVRSSRTYTAYCWGHRWVVLAVLVEVPGAARPWALPVLTALYTSREENARLGRRHKTPADLMEQLVALVLRGFPDRTFQMAGDVGFSTHAMARLAKRHPGRLTFVGKFYGNARLFDPPPPRRKKQPGRPRVCGNKRETPQEAVARARRRRRRTVAWYGGGRREVGLVSQSAQWYQPGQGLTPVRWVHVEDRTGTHRPEWLFSTDPAMAPEHIVEAYTGRWNIETTFEEARAYLGLSSTRGWCEATVLRHPPCLLGLYTVVVLLYGELAPDQQTQGVRAWEHKTHLTFVDAFGAVRLRVWHEWVFSDPVLGPPLKKLPPPVRDFLLHALIPAA